MIADQIKHLLIGAMAFCAICILVLLAQYVGLRLSESS